MEKTAYAFRRLKRQPATRPASVRRLKLKLIPSLTENMIRSSLSTFHEGFMEDDNIWYARPVSGMNWIMSSPSAVPMREERKIIKRI